MILSLFIQKDGVPFHLCSLISMSSRNMLYNFLHRDFGYILKSLLVCVFKFYFLILNLLYLLPKFCFYL